VEAISYRVTGMTCGGCARAVSKALAAQAPGAKIEVDLAAALVRVADGPDDAAVKQAIETAGFGYAGRT
jgi:copper chaperone